MEEWPQQECRAWDAGCCTGTHHKVCNERVQLLVAARPSLAAYADELREFAGGCASHMHAEPIQESLTLPQGLPPVSPWSGQANGGNL